MSIRHLHRFAVKGLGPDSLPSVSLQAGDAFPHDRAWALLKKEHQAKFDTRAPAWLHKEHFACAYTAGEALAALETVFDDESCTLTVRQRAPPREVRANLQAQDQVGTISLLQSSRSCGSCVQRVQRRCDTRERSRARSL